MSRAPNRSLYRAKPGPDPSRVEMSRDRDRPPIALLIKRAEMSLTSSIDPSPEPSKNELNRAEVRNKHAQRVGWT